MLVSISTIGLLLSNWKLIFLTCFHSSLYLFRLLFDTTYSFSCLATSVLIFNLKNLKTHSLLCLCHHYLPQQELFWRKLIPPSQISLVLTLLLAPSALKPLCYLFLIFSSSCKQMIIWCYRLGCFFVKIVFFLELLLHRKHSLMHLYTASIPLYCIIE